jgi:hypothetical protein
MPIYGNRNQGGNPFLDNMLRGMGLVESLAKMQALKAEDVRQEEELGIKRQEAGRKEQANAMLRARIGELSSIGQQHEQVAGNLLPMHETGQINLGPEQLSTLRGPAKSETGLNVKDMIDSLVLGIPLNQMSTARLEDTRSAGQRIENMASADKVQANRMMMNLVSRAASNNASPEDLAELRGIFAFMGVDPKNIIPEAGTPMEKALFNMGLTQARAGVEKTQAETGHARAQTQQSLAEGARIRARTGPEVALLGAQAGQAVSAGRLSEAGIVKAAEEIKKIQAEVKKVGVETGNAQVSQLIPVMEALGKPGSGVSMTPQIAQKLATNYVAATRQGGSTGDAIASGMDAVFPKAEKHKAVEQLLKDPTPIFAQMPKISKNDSPAMVGQKVQEAQEVARGYYFDVSRDIAREELGPRASEQEILQKTIMYLNSKILPSLKPLHNESGQFIGFESQYEDLKQPFSATKRIKEADTKMREGFISLRDRMKEFLGRGEKVLEEQDYYRKQKAKK